MLKHGFESDYKQHGGGSRLAIAIWQLGEPLVRTSNFERIGRRMKLTIHWHESGPMSAMHAAWALASGRTLVDAALQQAVALPAAELLAAVKSTNLPPPQVYRNLLPQSAGTLSHRMMAQTALTRLMPAGTMRELAAGRIADAFTQLDTAMRNALPKLATELPLRTRLLREQWEARGPGLWLYVSRRLGEEVLASEAKCVIVHPAIGGYGEAHLPFNMVRIEGMLANPIATLPEVVRLAWCAAQLQLDLPKYSEGIHPERLAHLARFAVLPAVLEAAAEVELIADPQLAMREAIAAWQIKAPADVDACSIVTNWWQTVSEIQAPMAASLKVLNEMFG